MSPKTSTTRVTSSQVAKLAGVSRTTVSFVLNDVPHMGISEETRMRVLSAARQLGYVPNAAAQSLVSGATRTVAIVTPHSEHLKVDAFIPRMLAGVNDTCHKYGYKVIFEPVIDTGRPGGGFIDMVDSRRIDGLIAINTPRSDDVHLARLASEGFPLVVFGSKLVEHANLYSIDVDMREASRAATLHLLSLGHRKVAYLGFASDEYHGVTERLYGYRDAMREFGLGAEFERVGFANFSVQSGYDAMKAMLECGPTFTALFAGNDTIAFGAMAAMRKAGLRIPEDIAVVGYDDIPLAAFAAPPLTTMRTSPYEQACEAATLLVRLMSGERPAELHSMMAVPLVIRESCGSPVVPAAAAAGESGTEAGPQ
ncbi:DNA-binding LacI/PurR family transcriptional regulator [Paraburkholderia sp. GAS199]|uniref:LacI family DNA-binding transcriptional regulator n=1 Tax=Paraburkholderia sp. GAS199 TaxID=3035126 RepID=UPI003D19DEE7